MGDDGQTKRQTRGVITFPSWKFLSLHFFSFYILVPQEPVEREMENEENFQNIPVTIDCLLKQVPEGMSLRTQSMVEREVSVITYWFHGSFLFLFQLLEPGDNSLLFPPM